MSVPAGQMVFGNMSAADIQQMLEAGEITGKQAILARQMKQAEALRDQGMPEGRVAGKMYVAPNPMEVIGKTLQRAYGYQESGALSDKEQDLLKQQTAARQKMLDEILDEWKKSNTSGVSNVPNQNVLGGP